MRKGYSDVPVKKDHPLADYDLVLNGVAELLESARRASARATNAVMTATLSLFSMELSNPAICI